VPREGSPFRLNKILFPAAAYLEALSGHASLRQYLSTEGTR